MGNSKITKNKIVPMPFRMLPQFSVNIYPKYKILDLYISSCNSLLNINATLFSYDDSYQNYIKYTRKLEKDLKENYRFLEEIIKDKKERTEKKYGSYRLYLSILQSLLYKSDIKRILKTIRDCINNNINVNDELFKIQILSEEEYKEKLKKAEEIKKMIYSALERKSKISYDEAVNLIKNVISE